MRVLFNRPPRVGRELDYITDALNRRHLSGDGHYTELCQDWLLRNVSGESARLTHSCTAALEMAAILADLEPGDEVIMPSFTFVSTANAVVLRGAVPVFVDIRRDTLNIDESLIEDAITSRTRAITVVHYAGVCCDMAPIGEIAARHNLLLIEDAAQALLSQYDGRAAGSFGSLACFSFHETKNIVSGEGGAIIVNDEKFGERADIIREKGTTRVQFRRRVVDKYTWVDIGSSYLPGELTAAHLWAQLEEAQHITARRKRLWEQYHEAFSHVERKGIARRPIVPSNCEHNGHLYYLLLNDRASRDRLIEDLRTDGILAPFHYIPLHSAPAGLRYARSCGELLNTEVVSERLIRLPLFDGLEHDQGFVIERVLSHLDRCA
jgi:dTDP-4-amino-4,6-dideoxygalactose transaminase